MEQEQTVLEPEQGQEAPEGGTPAPEVKADEGREAELARLQQQVASLEARLQQEESQSRERGSSLAGAQESLAEAVSRYRGALLASAPETPESLVQGATIQEVDDSFAGAKELARQIRERVEAELAQERTPAGAPPRTPPDPSALSPREKILSGLSGS